MTIYTVHDYHADWVHAKTAAHLDDKLFRKGLGKKLDQLNALYTQGMAANSKQFGGIMKKHTALVGDVKKIADAYRVVVNKNGKNAGALNILTLIYESGHRGMVDHMQDDLRDRLKHFI